jgi:hypothetical protein
MSTLDENRFPFIARVRVDASVDLWKTESAVEEVQAMWGGIVFGSDEKTGMPPETRSYGTGASKPHHGSTSAAQGG